MKVSIHDQQVWVDGTAVCDCRSLADAERILTAFRCQEAAVLLAEELRGFLAEERSLEELQQAYDRFTALREGWAAYARENLDPHLSALVQGARALDGPALGFEPRELQRLLVDLVHTRLIPLDTEQQVTAVRSALEETVPFAREIELVQRANAACETSAWVLEIRGAYCVLRFMFGGTDEVVWISGQSSSMLHAMKQKVVSIVSEHETKKKALDFISSQLKTMAAED